MGYGGYGAHGGWVVLIPFVLVFAMRFFGQGRRRSATGRQRPPVPGTQSSFKGPMSPPPGGASSPPPREGPVAASSGRGAGTSERAGPGIGSSGIAPGWLVDPSGRHEQRYWSGTEWTEHVTDGGAPGTDPMPG